MGDTLSQSDLDALFGGMEPGESACVEGAIGVAAAQEGLDMSQFDQERQRESGAGPSSGGETMTQDEIDALLAEFLG